MSTKQEIMLSNVKLMSAADTSGYDIIVLCTSTEFQAKYWQARLEAVRGQVLPKNCDIYAVHEDWEGGAGNGLGTLYAFEKACKVAAESKKDLLKQLYDGKSVGLYHTAGKGTRLAPLPGGENNNKPGVKLPGTVRVHGKDVPLTILESVLKQTSVYAKSRQSRLSVYWGDQIFIPTVSVEYKPTHHADILCILGEMPTAEEWTRKGLDKYGLIAVNQAGNAAQVEKVSYDDAIRLLKSLGSLASVGPSLGSFSISSYLLEALLVEFAEELKIKVGKFDTDPHFWMPFTLDKKSYVECMKKKGTNETESEEHFNRMETMRSKFMADEKVTKSSLEGLFGAVDIGQECYWWDYGQIKLYYSNNMRCIEDNDESEMYRNFLGIESRINKTDIGNAVVCGKSTLSSTYVGTGAVKSSVLTNVCVDEIDTSDSILVNVTARRVVAKRGCIIYNILDDSEEGINITEEGTVMVGVVDENGNQQIIRSKVSVDGGKNWKEPVFEGQPTFEDIYKANGSLDVAAIEKLSNKKHNELRKEIKPFNLFDPQYRLYLTAGIFAVAVGAFALKSRTRK